MGTRESTWYVAICDHCGKKHGEDEDVMYFESPEEAILSMTDYGASLPGGYDICSECWMDYADTLSEVERRRLERRDPLAEHAALGKLRGPVSAPLSPTPEGAPPSQITKKPTADSEVSSHVE